MPNTGSRLLNPALGEPAGQAGPASRGSRRALRETAGLLLLGLAFGLARAADAGDPGLRDGRFVVPRIAWARPLSGGSLKTLVIVPINGSRNAWDLADALDLDMTVFMVQDAEGRFGRREVFGVPSIRHWGLQYDEQMDRARAAFDRGPFDLILLANVCMSSLPPEIAYRLSAEVTAGAGLVMTNAEIRDPLLESLFTRNPLPGDALERLRPMPFDALEAGAPWTEGQRPAEALGAVKPYDLRGRFKAYTVGRGRFLSLPFPFEGVGWGSYSAAPALIPGILVNLRNRWQEDYYYGILAKACLWAAGREPAAGIRGVWPQGGELPLGERPEIRVDLAGGPGFRGRLEYELRDALTGRALAAGGREVTAAAEETTVVFEPDIRPVDTAFVLARLRDETGAVADFGAGFLRVRRETPLTLVLDKDSFDPPEPVTGRLEGPPGLAGAEIELSLFDSRARVWERAFVRLPEEGGAAAFSLPSDRTPLIVHGLRAVASVDGRPAAAAEAFLTIRRPRDPYYVTVSDEAWPTWLTIRRLERAYEWGADGLRDHKSGGHPLPNQPDANPVNQAIVNAMAGLDHNPGRPQIAAQLPFDASLMEAIAEAGRRNSLLYRPFNQAMYNTTDDCGPNLNRFVPASMPLFLDSLQSLYGSVSALNAEWETDFPSFSDIPPAFVAGARAAGRVPVWSDYLRFAGEAYLGAQARFREAIQAVDPEAASGCDAVYYGTSLARLYRELGYIMPYYRPWTVQFARSLAKAPPPAYAGICTGVYAYYSGTEPLNRRMPWHILVSGNNAFFFWSLICGFEGDLSTGGEQLIGWMMDEVSRIKLSGAAQWILGADREPAAAAILYSEESRRAESSLKGAFSPVEAAGTSFQEMLEDQGVPYHYLAAECIAEDGALDAPGLKLLILPAATALSAAEEAAIRAFVERGGTVWADIEPGVRSGHGRLLPQGRLDDLFGVARSGPAEKREVLWALPGREPIGAHADGAVRAADGEALLEADGVPLFIRRRQGAGAAVLLNLDPAFYGAGLGEGSDAERGTLGRRYAPAAATHAFLAGRLAEAGLKPRTVTLEGGPPIGLSLVEFSRGDGRLLTLEVKPVDGISYPATVRLPLDGRFHAYDLRSGRRWPATDVLEFEVGPNDVFVFSLLAELPGPLALEAPATAAPGDSVGVRARSGGGPQSTLLFFSLADPGGTIRRDYTRRVSTDGGEAGAVLPLPWNAPPGDWTLEARDLLTGRSARRTLTVREEQ